MTNADVSGYWKSVFAEAISQSLDFIGTTPTAILFATAVAMVVYFVDWRNAVAAYRERRLGAALWQGVRTSAIASVLFVALVLWHAARIAAVRGTPTPSVAVVSAPPIAPPSSNVTPSDSPSPTSPGRSAETSSRNEPAPRPRHVEPASMRPPSNAFTLTLNLSADSSCEQWGRAAGELTGAERNIFNEFQKSVEEATGLLERLVKADPTNTADYLMVIDQWGHSRANALEHAYGARGGVDFRTAESRDDILNQIPSETRSLLSEGQVRELRRTSGRLSCLKAIQDNLSRRVNQPAAVTATDVVEDLADRLLKGSALLATVNTANPEQFASAVTAWREGVLTSLRSSGHNAEAAIFASHNIPPLPRLVAPTNGANRQAWEALVIDTTNLRNLILEIRR